MLNTEKVYKTLLSRSGRTLILQKDRTDIIILPHRIR